MASPDPCTALFRTLQSQRRQAAIAAIVVVCGCLTLSTIMLLQCQQQCPAKFGQQQLQAMRASDSSMLATPPVHAPHDDSAIMPRTRSDLQPRVISSSVPQPQQAAYVEVRNKPGTPESLQLPQHMLDAAGNPIVQDGWSRLLYSNERMAAFRNCRVPGPKPLTDELLERLLRPERRVISYGLYGDNPRYVVGAYRNLELAAAVYPGWTVRIYHDHRVPRDDIARLSDLGAEMILMSTTNQGDAAGMFWRFMIADDATVDRYIIRDLDSRLSPREAAAVHEWIISGMKYHILRDHPSHSAWPMGGGKYAVGLRISERMQYWAQEAYANDMMFLRDSIYPLILHDSLAHDAWSCTPCDEDPTWCYGAWPNSEAFPTPRVRGQHVGQRFDEFDRPFLGDEQILIEAVPPPLCTPCFPGIEDKRRGKIKSSSRPMSVPRTFSDDNDETDDGRPAADKPKVSLPVAPDADKWRATTNAAQAHLDAQQKADRAFGDHPARARRREKQGLSMKQVGDVIAEPEPLEDEHEEASEPLRTALPKPVAIKTTQTAKPRTRVVEEPSDADEEYSDEEEESSEPAPPVKRSAPARARVVAAAPADDDEYSDESAEDEEVEQAPPQRNKQRRAAPAKRRAVESDESESESVDSDEQDEEPPRRPAAKLKPVSSPKPVKKPTARKPSSFADGSQQNDPDEQSAGNEPSDEAVVEDEEQSEAVKPSPVQPSKQTTERIIDSAHSDDLNQPQLPAPVLGAVEVEAEETESPDASTKVALPAATSTKPAEQASESESQPAPAVERIDFAAQPEPETHAIPIAVADGALDKLHTAADTEQPSEPHSLPPIPAVPSRTTSLSSSSERKPSNLPSVPPTSSPSSPSAVKSLQTAADASDTPVPDVPPISKPAIKPRSAKQSQSPSPADARAKQSGSAEQSPGRGTADGSKPSSAHAAKRLRGAPPPSSPSPSPSDAATDDKQRTF